ncbi:MAG: cytochrome P450, partial [Pseudomonadota bacterium]
MRDLATLDPSDVEGFVDGSISLAFARLRDDAPVHLCRESPFGPYWSVTRYDDIVGVEKDHERFSSSEGIALHDLNPDRDERFPIIIAMDPPAHTARRRITAGALAGDHLQHFAASIRDHTAATIDALPRNEPFD